TRRGGGPAAQVVRRPGGDPPPRRRPAHRAGYPIVDPRSGAGNYRLAKVSPRFRQQVRRIMRSAEFGRTPPDPPSTWKSIGHSGESSLARPALPSRTGIV